MEEVVKYNKFYDTGNPKREKENFQQFYFDRLDLSKSVVPISFYRSDFRGAKITDCSYFKNNFGNADFIDCVIENSSFISCSFKYSELYNSFYKKVFFQESVFSSASLVKLVFEDSSFVNIKFRVNTFRDCKYINTTIQDCDFHKSSMDEIEFESVSFNNVDLSGMTAMNLYFDNCIFENVVVDADYLGSYFFKGKLPGNIRLKYRGKIFDFDIRQLDLLNNLFMLLWEKGRYYEAINILVQKNVINKKNVSIIEPVKHALQLILSNPNVLRRTYQVEKIFRLFEYYFNSAHVAVSDYFKFIQFLDTRDFSTLRFDEQLVITEKIQKLKTIIDRLPLDDVFILNDGGDPIMVLEITINDEDKNAFEILFARIAHKIRTTIGLGSEFYYIAGIRKGSLIYDIVMYASGALVLLKILKASVKELRGIAHESMQFKIDYASNKTIMKQLESPVTLDKLQKIRKVQAASDKVIATNNVISKKDLNEFLPIIKKMVLHPNQLTDS
jgi:uncharacterized protein YjbI with pentapeptide repeats